MPTQINHWCKICGEGYHACNDCSNTASFTPWRVLTDTVSHYKIYIIIRDYTNHCITREQARELLQDGELTGLACFLPEIRNAIEEIMKEPPIIPILEL